jgi:hypothetical protein
MKMYLNDFKELTMAELLSVNGGYTTTAYYPSSSGGYKGTSVPTDQPAPPHSKVPEGYSPTSGWLPGWDENGYHGDEKSGYPSTSSGYSSTSGAGGGSISSGEGQTTSPTTVPTTGVPEDAIWGQITDADAEKIRMQDGGNVKMGDGAKLQLEGCKMAATAQIVTQITDGDAFSVIDVNEKADINQDGLLEQSEIAKYLKDGVGTSVNVTTDYWETQLSLDNIEKSLAKPGTHYILARAENVHGGDHWIALEGSYTNNQGQVEFNYNPSSENDTGRRFVLGSPLPGQENVYKITRVEIFTVN